ncbi:MAG: hypothetical protein M1816_000037 [Peltula sp. TS41687]|nr:MAG: hypothetical protein M1816_000037 [Peltula sp. TS41687]
MTSKRRMRKIKWLSGFSTAPAIYALGLMSHRFGALDAARDVLFRENQSTLDDLQAICPFLTAIRRPGLLLGPSDDHSP